MTPEQYKLVKDIFLAACDKPEPEQGPYILTACGGNEAVRREVESLLKEHTRGAQLMPTEPEGPLGPMSAILSRAKLEMGSTRSGSAGGTDALDVGGDVPAEAAPAGGGRKRDAAASFLDDSSVSQAPGTSTGYVDPGRFAAGTLANGRYRIIELLGRGGMGEVYRADDLMLNQSVALKFLPALFGNDNKWLERFRNEVRIARQVTHPNVCRVFDIGQFEGEQFISMEYIDGENLASLLRRIGRVPHDKAIQIARQLCAGLAAAHDRGVLHRDLKPANVMIDGRGAVRITDFGLAAPVDQLKSDAVRAGTPAYMSPEQLAGKPVTVRSDVYALGLVLYEMFTGRRTFRAESLREYQKLHTSEDPTPPSELLDDIDPIVERVILRCLEKDPRHRPASAMAVSAALPGGNPLREILAAGETPSPEVVAAAGEAHGVMQPRTAMTALVAAVVCVIAFVAMAPRLLVAQKAVREKEPAVLTYKAQTILNTLGYTDPARDRAAAFATNPAYYVRVENNTQVHDRLELLTRPRPGLVYYWYRQSPEWLVPLGADGAVAERDPAQTLPGMATVRLDPLGRLIGLWAQPVETVQSVPAPPEPVKPTTAPTDASPPPPAPLPAPRMMPVDWTPLLQAAEVDLTRFTPTAPQGAPPVFADTRAAWVGTFIDAPDEHVRVEAAGYQGRPVYFAIIGEWKEELLSEQRAIILSAGRSNLLVQTAVIAALLVTGGWMALKNYRSGRGDRQGASRMSLAFFLLGLVVWLFRAHHVSDVVYEFLLFQRGMGQVLYVVGLVWVFYMAMEPYVRRVWPETVISWSRMLSGKWLDPLVGRDVLAGAAIGAISTVLTALEYELPRRMGWLVPLPGFVSTTWTLNATRSIGSLFSSGIVALYVGLLLLLFLVLARMLTRRRWAAGAAFVLVFAAATARYGIDTPLHLGTEHLASWAMQGLMALLLLAVLTRYGLVGAIFCLLVRNLLIDFPVTWDFSVWYSATSMTAIGSVAAILGIGFYAALGGRGPAALSGPPRE